MKNKEILGIKNLLFLGLGLMIAIGLKYYYRQAGANDLLWILQPTTALVQAITGMDFVHESGIGFVSGNHQIIIAPACAGINFLIIAFCMGYFSFAHQFQSTWKKIQWIVASGISAYLATILVNTLRIIISICTYGAHIQYGWFTPERIHRLEGVVIYFLGLILLQALLKRSVHRFVDEQEDENLGIWKGFLGYILSSPLFWYCSVALVVPLINVFGQERSPRFWEHCVTAFSICIMLMLVIALKHWGKSKMKPRIKTSEIEGLHG